MNGSELGGCGDRAGGNVEKPVMAACAELVSRFTLRFMACDGKLARFRLHRPSRIPRLQGANSRSRRRSGALHVGRVTCTGCFGRRFARFLSR